MKLFSSSFFGLSFHILGTHLITSHNNITQLPLQICYKIKLPPQPKITSSLKQPFSILSLQAMAEEEQGHHQHHHLHHHHKDGGEFSDVVDYEKEKKHHKHLEHLGELGVAAAGAYALVID